MDMAGIKCGGFSKRCVIAPSGGNSRQSTDKLYAQTLFYLLYFAQQNRAYLSSGAHMRSSAGTQIKVGNVDKPKVAGLLGREFAQAKLPRFFQRHKPDAYRTIFRNHFISQELDPLRLRAGEGQSFQINSAAFFSHVKADRGHVEKLNERRRKNMLARVLLHVVASTDCINAAMDLCSSSKRFAGEMKDAAVFFIGHFGDGNLFSISGQ